MQYEKKIKYFDYYEHGERIKGAGFVKLEVRENILRLELTIRGLHPTDSFDRDVVLVGREMEEILGQITIKEGTGFFKHTCRMEHNIIPTNIPYEELQEIRIPVGGSRELCCTWKKRDKKTGKAPDKKVSPQMTVDYVEENLVPKVPETQISLPIDQPAEDSGPTAQIIEKREKNQTGADKSMPKKINPVKREAELQESIGLQESTGLQESAGLQESIGLQESMGMQESIGLQEGIRLQESIEVQENIGLQKSVETQESAELQAMWSQKNPDIDRVDSKPVVKLLEDKWQQLSAIYPHIRPFEDDREYISLGPSDFVMFPAKYYRAANNSFLLHGYYNYKHLILVRVERRGEALYYLGVPGNYFDREKQVALMFGFESFECAQEPARTGDFGYYMMRIEL